MGVANPVSPAAALLVLALPAVWLAGRTLARLVIDDRWSARLAAPGMAIALWILGLHVAGLAAGSFHAALWTGTLGVAAAGIVGLLLERRGRIAPPAAGWRPSRWMWPGAALAVAVIAPVTLGWAFHDELFHTGHMSMTAAIQNGGYPPRSLALPAFDLRYHYGFPLLNAALTSVFRLRIDVGIDLISLLSWGYLFVLLWALGDRVLGPGRGWITAVVTLFGGGFPFLCAGGGGSAASVLLGVCSIGGMYANPPFVSYFLQHPWTVGLPIALVLLATFCSNGRARYRYPALGLLLTALAICQIVLFAALAAALVAAEAVDAPRRPPRVGATSRHRFPAMRLHGGLSMLATSLLSLAAASRLGGFFAESPPGHGAPLVFDPGIADGALATVIWHAVSFGLLLPLGIAGILVMKQGRILALSLVAGGLVILNTLRHPSSWDIVKFAEIAALGLSVGASVVISRLLDARPKPLGIGAGGASFLGCVAAGVVFIGVIGTDMPGIPEHPFSRSAEYVSGDDAQAIAWLRREMRPGQIVYRDRLQALAYAQWGGLPQVRVDDIVGRFGTPPAILEDRARLLEDWPADPREWLDRGVAWFVIDAADSTLDAIVRRWLDSGRAVQRATFGDLRVVELRAGP